MDYNKSIIISDFNNAELLKLFHSTQTPGKREYRQHHHTEFEISVFISGKGTYTVGSKQYSFQKGDVFIFSSDEVHSITDIEAVEKLDLMNIHFEPRLIWSLGNDIFDFKFLKIFFSRNDKFENRLDRDNPATSEISELLFTIETEISKKNPEYELMIKVLLLHVLVIMIRSYDYVKYDNSTYVVHKQNLYNLEKAINYIDQNLSDDMTLDQLAKIANMSRTYFSTLFKKLNGISTWNYITIKRIEQSVVFLKTTDLSMLEIASKCGFNNSTNFNRAFKKVTGKTPSDYRQS